MSATHRGCLVDTNVLIRFANPHDPLNDTARRAVVSARQTYGLRVTSQNLVESWNVMTRPRDRNGFGHSIAQADTNLGLFERLFPRLPDPPDTYERWRKIVVRFGVSGVQVHDARLVVLMLAHGISHILTFNGRDFDRYSDLGIESIDPKAP